MQRGPGGAGSVLPLGFLLLQKQKRKPRRWRRRGAMETTCIILHPQVALYKSPRRMTERKRALEKSARRRRGIHMRQRFSVIKYLFGASHFRPPSTNWRRPSWPLFSPRRLGCVSTPGAISLESKTFRAGLGRTFEPRPTRLGSRCTERVAQQLPDRARALRWSGSCPRAHAPVAARQ